MSDRLIAPSLTAENHASSNPATIISVRAASRVYPVGATRVTALKDVTLDMPKGVLGALRGRSGSGKTTLLNALSRHIPPGDRVVTIEETAELRLTHPHVVGLEGRPPNPEGRGGVGLRDLVHTALRMRADRIIVGEVRGAEAFDMLQAMNVGHDGSLTTVHANTPDDVLRRLEALVLTGGMDLPRSAVREMIGSAIHLIVHLVRFRDGKRRVMSIREVVPAGDGYGTRELFHFKVEKARADGVVVGAHHANSSAIGFLDRIREQGFDVTRFRASDDPRQEEETES